MDVNVRIEITQGVRGRGIDVLRAQDDGTVRLADSLLFDRATSLGRVLVSHDSDTIMEAAERQVTGRASGGVIYAHQLGITIGKCIDELELVAKVYEPGEVLDTIIYLPLS